MSVRNLALVCTVCAAALASGCATKPEPLTAEDRAAFSDYLQKLGADGRNAPVVSITLEEAMARALKHNVDHRVAMMEAALAARDFDLSRYQLLPQVVANGGYYGRNNFAGASSRSLISGRESLEPSTSSERDLLTADLTASWNILDLGLSYIRSRQLADEALVQEERRRKVINDIIEEVQTTYLRAASADRLSRQLEDIKADVTKAYEDSRALYASRQTSPISALAYQRELNEIRTDALTLQRDLHSAKSRLAQLINLPTGQQFTIALPDRGAEPPSINLPLEAAIREALDQRPEVREAAYRLRMSDREITKAMLEALPGVDIYAGLNFDSNDFLFNNDWRSWGARASWNLIRLFETPMRRKRAKAFNALESERALATVTAVSSQVHLSLTRYAVLLESLRAAEQSNKVQKEILDHTIIAAEANKSSFQTLVRERMNSIITEARYDIAFADARAGFAAIHTTLGRDPYGPGLTGDETLEATATALGKHWAGLLRGESNTSNADVAAEPGTRVQRITPASSMKSSPDAR